MFRPKGLIVAMALVCFAIMAVNSSTALADEDIDIVLKKIRQTKRIVKNSVMSGEDIDRVVNKLNRSKRILKNKVVLRLNPPKTGQTTCYDEIGTQIPCAGTGQDGDWQMGAAWPNPRFTDNGDGTVTDKQTKLIWLKNANCFGTRTWANALSDCNNLADPQCGLSDGSSAGDWRLPNRFELESLIHLGLYMPSVPDTAGTGQWSEGDPFTNVQSSSFYWSATNYFAGYAWSVYMYDGGVNGDSKLVNWCVWSVRAGQ